MPAPLVDSLSEAQRVLDDLWEEVYEVPASDAIWRDIGAAGAVVGFAGTYTHYDTTTWGTAQCRVVRDEVQLRGSVRKPTAPAAGEGFLAVTRPELFPRRWAAWPFPNGALGYYQLNPASGVFAVIGTVAGNWFPLDNVRWSVRKDVA